MVDLVLIPTYMRPEYLSLCLEHVAKAKGDRDLAVRIFYDNRLGSQNPLTIKELQLTEQVVKQFSTQLDVAMQVRAPHPYVGNPSNFLEAYKTAYATDARYVYLIEDDVMVGWDFFKWHEAVQARNDYMCTVGWHCIRNPQAQVSNDPTAYIDTRRDFSSIGVCWKREKLGQVVKHAVKEYYQQMNVYLGRNFPKSPIGPGLWTEQAGLIMRILLETQQLVAWPCLSRCAHVGVSGYHRPGGFRFEGTLDERVAALRKAMQHTKQIVSLTKDPFDDIQSLPGVPPWNEEDLKVVQTFVWEGKL